MLFAALIARDHEHPKPTVNPLVGGGGLEVFLCCGILVEGVNEHRKFLVVDFSAASKRVDHNDRAAIEDPYEEVAGGVDAERFDAEAFGDGTVDQGTDDRETATRLKGKVDVPRVGMKGELSVLTEAEVFKERLMEVGENARTASFAEGRAACEVRHTAPDVRGNRFNM